MMRIMISLALVLFCSFCAISLAAEEVLTWEDCVREAQNNHPDLISAEEEIRQVEADKRISRSPMLPQITSEAEGKKSETARQEETDTFSYGISGRQLLFDGFKTSADVRAASERITAEEYTYAVVSSTIRLNLKTAFSDLLRAQELISLTEKIAERRRQNLDLVQLRYEAGREHRGSLLTAQANLAEAEFEMAQAKRNLSVAQRKLSKELGRDKNFSIRVTGSFDIIELSREQPDFESLAETTPFLKELIARKEAARLDLKSAESDFFPQVFLKGSFGETASDWPPRDDEWSTGVTISLPLFEGGSRIAQTAKNRSLLRQARANERSGRDSVFMTLEETWASLQDGIERVTVEKKFLDAALERAKIASAQYSSGLVTFDNWIIIEDNLVIAGKSFLNAQADLLIAEAEWIQAKGGLL